MLDLRKLTARAHICAWHHLLGGDCLTEQGLAVIRAQLLTDPAFADDPLAAGLLADVCAELAERAHVPDSPAGLDDLPPGPVTA